MKSMEELDRPGRRRFIGTCMAGVATWHFGVPVARAATPEASFALTSDMQADALRASVPEKVAASLVRKARESLSRASHVMPVVHTQGLLPHQGNRDESVLAQEDWRDTIVQALAWRLSGDEAHLARATAYVRDWLAVYRPSFDPIDETEVATWICGFDLVQSRLAPETVAAMRGFGRALADGYSAVPHRVGDHSTGLNNWQSHRIKLAAAGAFVSGDAARVAAARERFFAHVDSNIRDDGSTYDFAQRDALHYVVYTLEPMLVAASMAAAHGEDWYGAARSGAKLARALAWLQPYALGEKQHEEFVHSSVPFDQRRAAAGVKGFSGPWQPKAASVVYHIAAQLDTAFIPVSEALTPAPPQVQALYSRRFARSA
ncbi:alginate lyase family protein [Pandoraea apista]|uniref:alginate lyase family protein n=1 Tax=Pandoraea apista TaxID=93218 RepID=UPI0015627330|nr:alginate lyase family protein [Pandoraea apista]